MARFISDTTKVSADEKEVFSFLSDFRNFEKLMPPQVDGWVADERSCSFTIQGVASLSMRMAETTPYSNVHIVSEGKNPVNYKLDCYIKPVGEAGSEVVIEFDADLNPFMKAVASRPLQAFVNKLAERLALHFS